MTPLEILLIALLILLEAGLILFAIISYQEGHRRATRMSTLFACGLALLFILVLLATPQLQVIFTGTLGLGILVSTILCFLPVGKHIPPSPAPRTQVDERTIIFARAQLQPGSAEFNAYYQDHPQHLETDSAFRDHPGLLEPGAAFYSQILGSSPQASFFLTEALRNTVDGVVADKKVALPSEKMTALIKNLVTYHGGMDVGVCRLQPYHIYSHIGRGTGEYGAPIALDHTFAIAFTVEMAHEMINAAPQMPSVTESARQYAEAGKIAVILAAAIRDMGYPARAHIDGNYRVIAPLVAKDAGLGEIGRMGLLITPRLGPRVRLAVVTTSLPLIPDQPTFDPSVIDFCTICKKCAEVCPADALPFGDRQTYEDDTLRWKIDPERCYTYWTQIGTDCGRCMAVCPYAHTDHFLHNLIRFGVAQSGVFRRAANALDNLFYGKKPQPHSPPKWISEILK